MRSLSGTLLAAQKAATGSPFVRVVAENKVRSRTHYTFTELYSTADDNNPHDAEADSTYLHRAAANLGDGNVYYRRNNDSWTQLHSSAGSTNVAIAAVNNTRVIVIYNRGLNLYFRESTDQGSSFGAETLIVASVGTVNGIAVDYKNSSGDLAVIWCDNVTVKRIRRTAGAFGAAASYAGTFASLTGIACAWNGDFQIVITGTEITTTRRTLWSLVLGDGFSFPLDTFSAFFIQQQAESDEAIVYSAPHIGMVDTERITYTEVFSGSPAYTRTYWTTIVSGASFSPGNYEWMDPVPIDNTTSYGYAVTKGMTPDGAIYARPARVLKAPSAAVTLDMSNDLLEATIDERDGLDQRGLFIFDNSSGAYAGPPTPLQLHRTLDIGIGYDAEYSRPPAHTIVGWKYERQGGRSVFIIETRGAAYWLGNSRARTTIAETRKMTTLTRAAAARAGIAVVLSGASTRAAGLDLAWVVHPYQTQLAIITALAEIMPDVLLTLGGSGATIYVTEPAAGDGTDYTYGTDHAIYESSFRDTPPASVAEIHTPTLFGQAFDFTEMNDDKPLMDRRRSPHETVAADATAHASARLRKAQLAIDRGYLKTPPNCGIEVNDVVAWDDSAASGSTLKGRVSAIKTVMRRRDGTPTLYEQTIKLGGL